MKPGLWCGIVLLAAPVLFGVGETFSPLFVIERSLNRNVVHYDAKLRPDGSLDGEQPVIAYWILSDKDGRRQDLNLIERTKAYGFKTSTGPTNNSVQVTLVSDRTHPIVVYPSPERIISPF